MRTHLAALVVGALCLAAVRTAQATDSPFKAEDYRKALHGTISLKLTKAKDGGKPTLELAVAWVCKKAGVPYQVTRSRQLTNDKVKVRISPINCTDVVAGRAIVSLAGKAGLVMKIDDNGVYLVPKPEEAEGDSSPSAKLTLSQCMQLGRALQVEVKALHGKEIDRDYWRDKEIEQQVQLSIKITPTKAFGSLKVVAYMYARIQKHSRRSSKYEDDTRPRYGPNKDFVEFHKETITVSGLPRLQARELKTKAVTTEYELYDGWYSEDRRYGEKYYGCVVDFYIGDQLIKSVASTRKMFELIGRDQRTGFPLK